MRSNLVAVRSAQECQEVWLGNAIAIAELVGCVLEERSLLLPLLDKNGFQLASSSACIYWPLSVLLSYKPTVGIDWILMFIISPKSNHKTQKSRKFSIMHTQLSMGQPKLKFLAC